MTTSVVEATEFGTKNLSGHRVLHPKLDAEILLSHVLGCERIDVYLNYDRPLTDEEFARYTEILEERVSGKPLQYITGRADFFGHRFSIHEGVFIPRRETEVLVDMAMRELSGQKELFIVDIGTGSGNVAISLAIGLPTARVIGTDISTTALALARENASRLGVPDRVQFVEADLFPPPSLLSNPVNLIISNPPYVAEAELQSLPAEVRAEPIETYFGGEDGLDFIRGIVNRGREYLSLDGAVAIEFGDGQGKRVEMLLTQAGYEEVQLVKDLSDRHRIAIGHQPK